MKAIKNATNLFSKGLLVLFLIMLLAACGGGEDDPPTDTDDGSSSLDCSGDTPDDGCGEDNDNDGLTYMHETEGWEVWPDKSGLGDGVEQASRYTVTSDPDKADTDGDGVDDNQEFLSKTDPRKADTDGDGLSDEEELNRWGTSPVSVDTDGDCRGPNKDQAPNSALFDGAELKIDFANDPGHTPGTGATSPLFKDTDGDGWTDYYEIVETLGQGFDPVIADIPTISIEISDTPYIGFNGSTSQSVTWEESFSVTDTLSQSVSREISNSKSTELVVENTSGFGMTHGWEAGAEGWSFVGKVNGSYALNWGTSNASSTAQSVAWTSGLARTAETAHQQQYGEGGSRADETTGGHISVSVTLHNNGDIAYKLSGLRINVVARYIAGAGNFIPVMELLMEGNPITIGPGNSVSNILMKGESEDPALISDLRDLLKNPSGLMFEVSSYELTDSEDKSFTFSEETIKQKSALVVIDFGVEAPAEKYLVATTPSRISGQDNGVTMATVMTDILGIDFNTTSVTDAHGTYRVLSSVKGYNNDPAKYKKWLLATSGAIENEGTPIDFDDLQLQAGDTIKLIFVKDEDGDGLSAREEFLSDTSDVNPDTDGDGLSDFEEVREGWTVTLAGQLGYEVKSRGYSQDSDGDAISDDDEKACGLDPNRIDSDQDGLNDYEEIHGYGIFKPYSGIVILDGGNGTIDTTVTGDDVAVVTGTIDPGTVIISAGPDGVINSSPGGDDYVGVEHTAMPCVLGSSFATDPLDGDTDGDSVSDYGEWDIGLGSPNDPADIALYTDTDQDGLSDATETAGYTATVNDNSVHFTSDPNVPDSDDDGLPDLLEHKLKSNPMSVDTDGDTLLDFDEYAFDESDQAWIEFSNICTNGNNPNCFVPVAPATSHGTEINDADTDGDQLSDGIEVNGWEVVVNEGRYDQAHYIFLNKTDPLVNEGDKDLDGLSDYQEFVHKTDPTKQDTDDDDTWDGAELTRCGNPSYLHFGGCRDPLYWDRKITVTYDTIKFGGKNQNTHGNCDLGFFGKPLNPIELSWMLGVRIHPLAIFFWSLSTSGSGGSVKPVTPPYNQSLNKSISFIAHENDQFELGGFVREMDGAGEDAEMIFYDQACNDCPASFDGTSDRPNRFVEDRTTQEFKFTVSQSTATKTLRYYRESETAFEKCGTADDSYTWGSDDWSIEVNATIKVE
ncbi:MAG: hypothetical protein KKE17_01765 [Proteobacteria bacterium]|nr:hypothetical protein [Pseudomonadota bacterium]MBU1708709.1 hypothetical protein [Pseudomonadota bacterium]